MSAYISGSGSYEAYLQAKSFVDDIRWEISKANLDLVASSNALQTQGFRIERGVGRVETELKSGVSRIAGDLQRGFSDMSQALDQGLSAVSQGLGQIDGTLMEGFVVLHSDLSSIGNTVNKLSAKFDWGLARLEAAIGGVNDTLQNLVKLARTPEQTWAYEQFEIARDAFSQRLYPEALEHVDRAINGYLSHTGYKLEHRFHYLCGIIRRGAYTNSSPDIVNLPQAELAYLNAARYAEANYKPDAAQALCAAAWVAYCQDRVNEAVNYATRSIAIFPLPETNYLLAKFFFHRGGEAQTALQLFSKALDSDPLYAVRCFDDPDFQTHETDIRALIATRRASIQKQYTERALPIFEDAISTFVEQWGTLISKGRAIGLQFDFLEYELSADAQPVRLSNEAPFVDLALAAQSIQARVDFFARNLDVIFTLRASAMAINPRMMWYEGVLDRARAAFRADIDKIKSDAGWFPLSQRKKQERQERLIADASKQEKESASKVADEAWAAFSALDEEFGFFKDAMLQKVRALQSGVILIKY